ncbi:hypothetical protein BI292_05290 [Pseudomonas sp. 43NM1]|nr:hypothetical protein BI292_05290 [Pseudomonas sp. 43NM1]
MSNPRLTEVTEGKMVWSRCIYRTLTEGYKNALAIKELKEAGFSRKDVMEKLGLSRSTVYGHWKNRVDSTRRSHCEHSLVQA